MSAKRRRLKNGSVAMEKGRKEVMIGKGRNSPKRATDGNERVGGNDEAEDGAVALGAAALES